MDGCYYYTKMIAYQNLIRTTFSVKVCFTHHKVRSINSKFTSRLDEFEIFETASLHVRRESIVLCVDTVCGGSKVVRRLLLSLSDFRAKSRLWEGSVQYGPQIGADVA